jgi:hypothetical protein
MPRSPRRRGGRIFARRLSAVHSAEFQLAIAAAVFSFTGKKDHQSFPALQLSDCEERGTALRTHSFLDNVEGRARAQLTCNLPQQRFIY